MIEGSRGAGVLLGLVALGCSFLAVWKVQGPPQHSGRSELDAQTSELSSSLGFPNPNNGLYDGLYHIRAVAKPPKAHKLSDNYIPDYVKSLPDAKRVDRRERKLKRLSPAQQMLRLSKQTVRDMRHTSRAAVTLPGSLGLVKEDTQNVLGALSVSSRPNKHEQVGQRRSERRRGRGRSQRVVTGTLDKVPEDKKNVMGSLGSLPTRKSSVGGALAQLSGHQRVKPPKAAKRWSDVHESDRERATDPMNEYALRDLVRREREYLHRSRLRPPQPEVDEPLKTGPLSLRHILNHFKEYERDFESIF